MKYILTNRMCILPISGHNYITDSASLFDRALEFGQEFCTRPRVFLHAAVLGGEHFSGDLHLNMGEIQGPSELLIGFR